MTPVDRVVVHDTAERLAALRARGARPARGRQDRRARDRDRAGAAGRGRARAARRRVSSPGDRHLAPGVARRAREHGDRRRVSRRRPASGARPRSSASARCCKYLGSPQLEYPAVHLTGTNGKTTDDAHDRRAARRRSGYSVGAYTSPHLRARQRAHRAQRRAHRRRRARRAAPRRRARRARDRARSVVLRGRDRGGVAAGSPTSRSTSRWSRSVSAERGTRPT